MTNIPFKKIGQFVITCTEVKKHNLGAEMGNVGLGIVLAIVGNRLTINAVEPKIIIGKEDTRAWFMNVFKKCDKAD